MPINDDDVAALLAYKVDYLKQVDYQARMQHAIEVTRYLVDRQGRAEAEVSRLTEANCRLRNNTSDQYETIIADLQQKVIAAELKRAAGDEEIQTLRGDLDEARRADDINCELCVKLMDQMGVVSVDELPGHIRSLQRDLIGVQKKLIDAMQRDRETPAPDSPISEKSTGTVRVATDQFRHQPVDTNPFAEQAPITAPPYMQRWTNIQSEQADFKRRTEIRKYPKFDGDFGEANTNWEKWLKTFNFTFRNASEEFKADSLEYVLKDKALSAYEHLTDAQRALPFQQLCDLLGKDLVDKSGAHRVNLIDEVTTLQQGKRGVQEFIAELDKKSQIAYPAATYSVTSIAELKLNSLIKGLNIGEMRSKLHSKVSLKSDPVERYAFICQEAINMERNDKRYTEFNKNQQSTNGDTRSNSDSRGDSKPFSTFTKFKGKREHGKDQDSNAQKNTAKLSKSGGTSTGAKNQLTCTHCGKTGHEANSCYSNPDSASFKNWKAKKTSKDAKTAKNAAVTIVSTNKTSAEGHADFVDQFFTRSLHLQEGSKVKGLIGSRLFLDMAMYGEEVKVFVDPGSDTSLVTKSYLKQLIRAKNWSKAEALAQLQLQELQGVNLLAVNKSPVKVMGTAVLSIESHGIKSTVTAVVQDDESDPETEYGLLAGANALEEVGIALLNTRTGKIVNLKHGPILEQMTDKIGVKSPKSTKEGTVTAKVNKVHVVRRVLLPGLSRRAVEFAVSESDFAEGLFEQGEETPSCLRSANSFITLEDNRFRAIVENTSDMPIALQASYEFGLLVPGTLVEGTELETEVVQSQAHRALAAARISSVETTETESTEKRKQLESAIDWSRSVVNEEEKEEMFRLLIDYYNLFAFSEEELTQTSLVKHHIDTGDARPVKQPQRPVAHGLRDRVDQLIRDYLDRGIVQKSKSPWASPIVLVKKKDGSVRFCVDYRKLNELTRKDSYPLPNIDDILAQFDGKRWFTTMDMFAGYWQIAMSEESKPKTAFSTMNGHYEFNVMPFGLTNAPATFERFMEEVLEGINGTFVQVYIDDVMIASETFEQHIAHLTEVLTRLRAAGLKLKPSKCTFGRDEVEFLGHIVGVRGLKMDPSKVEKVREFPRPTSVVHVQRFLGLTGYYRRFIQGYGTIAKPLTLLTRKDHPFLWTDACENTFDQLRKALCEKPVLIFPNFEKAKSGDWPFILYTDASMTGVAAVLAQRSKDGQIHPIAYYSHGCSKAEQNYSITDLEALAVVMAVRRFRPFLLEYRFQIVTDHEPLKWIFGPSKNKRITRWWQELSEYQADIIYRPGKQNANADTLSRMYEECEPSAGESIPHERILNCSKVIVAKNPVDSISQDEQIPESDHWTSELRDDPEFSKVVERLEAGDKNGDFELIDGQLCHFRKGKALKVVPQSKRRPLFFEFHSGPFGAHLAKTVSIIKRTYFWPKMEIDCKSWSRSCLICAANRTKGRQYPPMISIESHQPFQIIGVDFCKIGGISGEGNKYMIVFVDHFTKYAQAYATPDKEAQTVAKIFLREVVCRHGAPQKLLSDRGGEFLNLVMTETLQMLGTEKLNTVSYHPQCNGITERMNSTLLGMLRKSTVIPTDWDERLPYVLFNYNTAVHDSTGETPYFLVHGRDPRFPSEVDPDLQINKKYVDLDDFKTKQLSLIQETIGRIRENLEKARQRQKTQYDRIKKTNSDIFKVGDRVMVRDPLIEQSAKIPKMTWKCYGPYRIYELRETDAGLRLVDKPDDSLQFVRLDRLIPVFEELPNISYEGKAGQRRKLRKQARVDLLKKGGGKKANENTHHMQTRAKTSATPRVLMIKTVFVMSSDFSTDTDTETKKRHERVRYKNERPSEQDERMETHRIDRNRSSRSDLPSSSHRQRHPERRGQLQSEVHVMERGKSRGSRHRSDSRRHGDTGYRGRVDRDDRDNGYRGGHRDRGATFRGGHRYDGQRTHRSRHRSGSYKPNPDRLVLHPGETMQHGQTHWNADNRQEIRSKFGQMNTSNGMPPEQQSREPEQRNVPPEQMLPTDQQQERRQTVGERLNQMMPGRICNDIVLLCGLDVASGIRHGMDKSGIKMSNKLRVGYLGQLAAQLPLCILSEKTELLVITGGEAELEWMVPMEGLMELYRQLITVIQGKWPWIKVLIIPPIRMPGHITARMMRLNVTTLAQGYMIRVAASVLPSEYDIYGQLANTPGSQQPDGRLSNVGKRVVAKMCITVLEENRSATSGMPRVGNDGDW